MIDTGDAPNTPSPPEHMSPVCVDVRQSCAHVNAIFSASSADVRASR